MNVTCDLSSCPANFEILGFLVMARTAGATHVIFDRTKGYKAKYSDEETERRIENILEPACALAGVTYEHGAGNGNVGAWGLKAFLDFYRERRSFVPLRSVLPPGTERFTVTLRQTERYPAKNSNEAAWRRFAEEIGARVVEDYAVQPIGLHERMALYAGAQMNFFLNSGPAGLCSLGGLPYVMVMKYPPDKTRSWDRVGLPIGSQFPWARADQVLVWADDDYDGICAAARAVGVLL